MEPSLLPRLTGQKVMEKMTKVTVVLLLVGLCLAGIPCKIDKDCRRDVCIDLNCAARSVAGGRCNVNSHCFNSANVCINKACSPLSPAGGPCDSSDNSDCAVASSTCSPNNVCLSPTDGPCTKNDQCASSSDSCIGQKCKPLSPVGGPCDSSDNSDCVVASSTCSANNVCLSPTDGPCTKNDQCASSSDSCIGQKCKPKGGKGGTCDTNDDADCAPGYECDDTTCSFNLPSFQWDGNQAMSTPRNHAASVAVGGFLYVFGGIAPSTSFTASAEMYNPQNNSWVTKADAPVAVWKHAVVAVGKYIYLIGGADVSSDGQNNFFRYDTEENSWSKVSDLAQLPIPKLHSLAAAVVDTAIFIFGGQTGSSTSTALSAIYMFDTAAPEKGWSSPANLPTPLTQASAVTVGTLIYITGGLNDKNANQGTFVYDVTTPSNPPKDLTLPLTVPRVYQASFYNPKTRKIHLVGGITSANRANTVETLDLKASTLAWAPEPSAALNLANLPRTGGFIDSRFYFAGSTDNRVGNYPSTLLHVLDVSGSPKWVPFTDSPTPSYYAAVGKVGSTIITVSGTDQGGTLPISQAYLFNIGTNEWSTAGATITARHQLGSAVVGTEMFYFGGYSFGNPTTETYSLNADQSVATKRSDLKVGRRGICATSEGSKIFAYGGIDSANNYLDTMEIYETANGQPGFDSWRDVTASAKSVNKPLGVAFCAAVSTGSKILIFGGRKDSDATNAVGIIQSFDIKTEQWDPPIPIETSSITARYHLSAANLNGFIVVAGGTPNGSEALATAEAYEIATGKVSSLPGMYSPRFGHGTVTDGDSVFVVGGQNGILISPLEKFTPFSA